MCLRVLICVYVYVNVCACIGICVGVGVCVCALVCGCVFVYLNTSVRVCVLCVYVDIFALLLTPNCYLLTLVH